MSIPKTTASAKVSNKMASKSSNSTKAKYHVIAVSEEDDASAATLANQRRGLRIFLMLGALLVAIIGGAGFLWKKNSCKNDLLSKQSDRFRYLYHLLELQEESLELDSPRFQALDWLSNLDEYTQTTLLPQPEQQVDDTLANVLLERYILALVYFEMHGHGWVSDFEFLSPQSHCDWQRVRCDDETGLVQVLMLVGNHLHGNILTEFGRMTKLDSLQLGGNMMNGTIPTELGQLEYLETLSLHDNQFTGTIPTELGRLTNIQKLELDRNRLEGTIPAEFANFQQIHIMHLELNQLEGNLTELVCPNFDDPLGTLGADCLLDRVDCDCCTLCCSMSGCISEKDDQDDGDNGYGSFFGGGYL